MRELHLFLLRPALRVSTSRQISGNWTFCNVTQGIDSSIRLHLQPGVGCDLWCPDFVPCQSCWKVQPNISFSRKLKKQAFFFPCTVSWKINRAKLLHWSWDEKRSENGEYHETFKYFCIQSYWHKVAPKISQTHCSSNGSFCYYTSQQIYRCLRFGYRQRVFQMTVPDNLSFYLQGKKTTWQMLTIRQAWRSRLAGPSITIRLFICLLVVTQHSATALMSAEPPWLQIVGRKTNQNQSWLKTTCREAHLMARAVDWQDPIHEDVTLLKFYHRYNNLNFKKSESKVGLY